MDFRTDRNDNPLAFTTDVAKMALKEGIDYIVGDSFIEEGHKFYTAKLIKDPISTCINLIDHIGFFTKFNHQRWIYIGIPKRLWDTFTHKQKLITVAEMYRREGGRKFTAEIESRIENA